MLWRDVLDLLVASVLEEELERPLQTDAEIGMRTNPYRRAVEREGQRRSGVQRVDPEDLARPEIERIVHDQVGETGDARIGHPCLIQD
jgi:hypothetical protein